MTHTYTVHLTSLWSDGVREAKPIFVMNVHITNHYNAHAKPSVSQQLFLKRSYRGHLPIPWRSIPDAKEKRPMRSVKNIPLAFSRRRIGVMNNTSRNLSAGKKKDTSSATPHSIAASHYSIASDRYSP